MKIEIGRFGVLPRTFAYGVLAIVLAVSSVALSFRSAYAAGEVVTEFSIPTGGADSAYIINGPDGKLWFTMYSKAKFGTIDPITKAITEYPLTPGTNESFGMAVDAQKNVWIANNIGLTKINPLTYAVTDYPISGGAYALSLGGDGNLYFTQLGAGKVGKFDLTTFTPTIYDPPTASSMPGGIVRGNDGKLYFTMENADKIGVLDPANNNTITEYYVGSSGVHPFQIAIAADGNIWFTEYTGNIGKFDVTTHTITEYTTPTPDSNPYGIFAGSDGNIWFTQHSANNLARVNIQTGVITEYSIIPTAGSGPYGIVGGIDGNIWYTELNANKIGTLSGVSGFQPVDDGDGVSKAVEDAAPNGGDGNNDGIADSTQSNVTSFVNSVTGRYVTLELDAICSITRATAVAETTNVVQDADYVYPNGLVDFAANCGVPGYETTAKVYFYGGDSGLTVRKYNPTTQQYAAITNATQSSQTISGNSVQVVEYQVTDGDELDADGLANGVIVDPVGLALYSPVSAGGLDPGGTIPGTPNTGLRTKNSEPGLTPSVALQLIVAVILSGLGAGIVYRFFGRRS